MMKAFLPYSKCKNTQIPQYYQGAGAILLHLHIWFNLNIRHFDHLLLQYPGY